MKSLHITPQVFLSCTISYQSPLLMPTTLIFAVVTSLNLLSCIGLFFTSLPKRSYFIKTNWVPYRLGGQAITIDVSSRCLQPSPSSLIQVMLKSIGAKTYPCCILHFYGASYWFIHSDINFVDMSLLNDIIIPNVVCSIPQTFEIYKKYEQRVIKLSVFLNQFSSSKT